MGNNSWMDSVFFSRHLVPQNVGNIIFVCYFLNIGLGTTKSQCSRHFSKKSIPGLPRLEPHRKVMPQLWNVSPQTFKTLQKTANLFSNLDFLQKSGFPKTLDSSMDFPPGFPTPWISHPMAGLSRPGSGGHLPTPVGYLPTPVGRKTGFSAKKQILLHMAIQAVLT